MTTTTTKLFLTVINYSTLFQTFWLMTTTTTKEKKTVDFDYHPKRERQRERNIVSSIGQRMIQFWNRYGYRWKLIDRSKQIKIEFKEKKKKRIAETIHIGNFNPKDHCYHWYQINL